MGARRRQRGRPGFFDANVTRVVRREKLGPKRPPHLQPHPFRHETLRRQHPSRRLSLCATGHRALRVRQHRHAVRAQLRERSARRAEVRHDDVAGLDDLRERPLRQRARGERVHGHVWPLRAHGVERRLSGCADHRVLPAQRAREFSDRVLTGRRSARLVRRDGRQRGRGPATARLGRARPQWRLRRRALLDAGLEPLRDRRRSCRRAGDLVSQRRAGDDDLRSRVASC
jgi:hypothetical protein